MKVLYSKFTRERNPQFQLETSIVEDEQGIKTVQKRALNPSGKKHIVNMYENYLRFSKKDTSYFLECTYKDDKVIFPYVEGKSLYAKNGNSPALSNSLYTAVSSNNMIRSVS